MTAPLNLDGFLPLIRPRIVFLVGVSAAAGMFLVQPASLAPLPWLLAGTMLVAAAGCALNHLLEREADASMERTQNRPLVTGSMTVGQVKGVGLSGLVVGLSLLAFGCSWVVAAIELGAAVIYLGLYTPLKSRTTSNTWVGAISGAAPVLAGAQAGGGIDRLVLTVFGLVFLWQLPHFFAIASVYRDEYRRGGMKMLSGADPEDAQLRWQMPLQVMSVVLVSWLPVMEGDAHLTYGVTALLLGGVFLGSAWRFRNRADSESAKGVVRVSVAYLPLVLLALVMDRTGPIVASEHDHLAEETSAACCAPDDALAAEVPAQVALREDGGGADLAPTPPGTSPSSSEPAYPDVPAVDDHLALYVEDGTGLPSFGTLPEFTLVDQNGEGFGLPQMEGEIWVVDFIFTRCAGICIPMTRAMVDMQEDHVDVRYLSVTVDPGYDSPDVLTKYREKWDGDEEAWMLATGSSAAITDLSEKGFSLPVRTRRETPVEGMPSIFHSGRFALVDAAGRVRGFYSHDDQLELRRLREDIETLSAASSGL